MSQHTSDEKPNPSNITPNNPEYTAENNAESNAALITAHNANDLSNSVNTIPPLNPTIFLCIGFIIWFVATLAIRSFGHYIFQPNEPLLALALYLLSSFAVILLALSIFTWQNLQPSQQFQATILLALPGMLLDSIVMVSFRSIFPSLAPSSDSAVASWLLWSYAFVLIAAFMQREKTTSSKEQHQEQSEKQGEKR